MKSKTIWHVGGYNRNYGDFVLLESIRENLEKQSDIPLNFVNVDCQSTHFFPELIDELNETADMLLIGGGGFIMNRHEDNSLSGWQWSIKNEDIAKINVPIVVYGIGYNKFNYDNRGFKKQMNQSLIITQKSAKLFSVRNNGTKEELITRGLNENDIEVIPDPGMFISPRFINVKFLNSGRMLIGLNFVSDRPQYTYPDDYNNTKNIIMENLINSCKYFVEKYNALIINIDHIPVLDEEVNIKFKNELGPNNYLVLSEEIPEIYPPSLINSHFFAYIYTKMNVVIGMRGHSNIISFGMGTPFISMGSHNKNRFFTKEIGEEKYLIDLRDYKNTAKCDIIIKQVEGLLQDKECKNRTLERRNELEKKFIDFNNKIIRILKEEQ